MASCFSLLYLAAILMATAGCSRRSLAQPDHPAGTSSPSWLQQSPQIPHPSFRAEDSPSKCHAQKKETSRHFDDDVYGVSFDFPKNYDLHEGDLPDMDRGLGYLGTIPMKFSAPGGVRLATVEVPRTAHPGTDFVNAFLPVSVFPNVTPSSAPNFAQPMVTARQPRAAKLTASHSAAKKESAAASMHQYSGTYLHGYAKSPATKLVTASPLRATAQWMAFGK